MYCKLGKGMSANIGQRLPKTNEELDSFYS